MAHEQAPTRWNLKRTAVTLLRLALAFLVAGALPFAYVEWANDPEGSLAVVFGCLCIGMVAGAVYFVIGSVLEFLLRKKPLKYTLILDLVLFSMFAGTLIYWGVTVESIDGSAVVATPRAAELQGFSPELQQRFFPDSVPEP